MAALLCAALLLLPGQARSGDSLPGAEPDQLEALFVQRLVRYVTWPGAAGPGPGGPVVVAATDARRLRPYFADLP
ncbi:MAG: YfiR family protein, partial [Pseudodesulfovibrio sp.]